MPTLADDLAAALDPVALARRMGLAPDPWQARVLRSPANRVMLNCARQVGKSTVTSILAGHAALYDPGALILLLSPSLRQSGELFRKVRAGLRALGDATVDLPTDNALSLETATGSRIVSLPGNEGTVRGFSGVHLLIVDEASRVPDALYRAIRPMLATASGRLVTLSTPFGKRGWWHEAWRSEDDWERYEVPATACPRIPPAFLAEERRALGPLFYGQEYECRFNDATSSVFATEDIDAALDDDLLPFFPANQEVAR